MKECKGLFGLIFGHCYQSHLIEYNPPRLTEFDMRGRVVETIESLATKKYIVRCKRCGEKDEVKQ